MRKKLFDWQVKCLEHWTENGCKGIVNVVTGAGKTVLAMGAIDMVEDENIRVKIVVPKIHLMLQWVQALKDELGIDPDQIGCYSGAYKDSCDKKYMVYVVNSARYSLARHIVDDWNRGIQLLLIADECHHYGTKENSRIFDFRKIVGDRYYALGLSATPYCEGFDNILNPSVGNEIFSYGFNNAIKEGIIKDFFIFNIRTWFTDIEKMEYAELSDAISKNLIYLKQRCPSLRAKNDRQFFAELNSLATKHEDDDIQEAARIAFTLFYKRREVVYLAKARVDCVISLVRSLSPSSRIIIFGERIEIAELIYERLKKTIPLDVGIYHSAMDAEHRKNILRMYRNHEIRVLVSCKALDEGLNVPETDVGILVSSSNSSRQKIQRLGRVLRKNKHGKYARLYYLFIGQSNEEEEMLTEMMKAFERRNIINMEYDDETSMFINYEYDDLAKSVLTDAAEKGKVVFDEVKRNLFLGLLNCDWKLSAEDCKALIAKSADRAERNYYTVMLLMIRAGEAKGAGNRDGS